MVEHSTARTSTNKSMSDNLQGNEYHDLILDLSKLKYYDPNEKKKWLTNNGNYRTVNMPVDLLQRIQILAEQLKEQLSETDHE